jgi:hypothetical protein
MGRHTSTPTDSPSKPKYKPIGTNDGTLGASESRTTRAPEPQSLPTPTLEIDHAVPTPDEANEAPQQKATEAEVMAAYYASPGHCPLCKIRIGRGIFGHISKCLRIWNSKIESTPIT